MKLIEMIFGDENTLFLGFDGEIEHNRVKLTTTGFAEEWSETVDYEESFAFIKNNELHVEVCILEWIDSDSVKDYFTSTMEQYLTQEYGEFFETQPGCPICVNVEHNGNKITL